MNFAIDAIVLFSLKGERRRLPFNRNGINVITGESGTGKTAILDIIDYCFLASNHKISDSVINENVSWYGLELFINEKEFFIARRAPIGNKVSDEYFFSQNSIEYTTPSNNIAEDDLKSLLEAAFGIDSRATVPYGGRALKAGSKLSFRYFFLFNTVSQDIITNSEVFFDRQNEERYREALPRIFDLALGIDDLPNISAREKREELLKEAARLRKKSEHIGHREKLFEQETNSIIRQAIKFGLMDGKKENTTSADIRQMINDSYREPDTGWEERHSEITSKIFAIGNRIRMLKRFSQETFSYKQALSDVEDSLKPIMAIFSRNDEIIKTDAFDDLISSLKSDLSNIKEEISRKKPIDCQVNDLIKALNGQKDELTRQLESIPPNPEAFQSERAKLLFIGETKAKLDIFVEVPAALSQSGHSFEDVESEAAAIFVRNVEDERQQVIRAIEYIALDLKNQIKPVLENYAEYVPAFNYKEKKLEMTKPRSGLVENVGSSSNHMFMHLLHFMALQEVAISRKSRFVPSFLILDQPSRPYYGDEERTNKMESLPKTDTGKITAAFKLLNDFIKHINTEYNSLFQMIVFEHVPVSIFAGMENIHIVEKFRDGVALIPRNWIEYNQ